MTDDVGIVEHSRTDINRRKHNILETLTPGIRVLNCVLCCCLILLTIGCVQREEIDYIDFLKVSDQTYLGIEELADSLDVPWDMQYNPTTNSIFFTEIKGNISELNLKTNERKVIYTVPRVYHQRTLGLLSLVLHPDFEHKPYLYTCYTVKEGDDIFSELLRLRYEDGRISEPKVLLRVGGARGHNGSRMTFGEDNILYWATGDALSETSSQDSTSLNGKVLRITDEGNIPEDNPIEGSYVYAWGFRNIQGITFTPKGRLIVSEHGDAIEDELNWVRPLHNYGWKKIEGYHDLPEEQDYARQYSTTEPIKAWTPVIAPAAVHYPRFNNIPEWDNALLLGTLKDQNLHVIRLDEQQTRVLEDRVYLKDSYGRIRAVTSDDKGNIYIATSNRDWKPQTDFPKERDDRILRLSKIDFVPDHYLQENKEEQVQAGNGKALYQAYCASCHHAEGIGVDGMFPPLIQTQWVAEEQRLVDVLLNGLSGTRVEGVDYDQSMPSFNFLSNQELAEIATYVRANFGNKYSAIDSTVIKASRKK